MPRALGAAFFLLSTGLVLHAQMMDRCSPGWSMLNQLREQLTPETPQETLELLHVSIAKRLENCRGIPDLWYYRALVSERVHDLKDANYARQKAAEQGSQALLGKVSPFDAPPPVVAAKLSPTIGEKYALVVGINEFEHASSLRFAVNDAESVADLLADPQVGRFRKSNVFRLTNGDATLQGVKTAIGEIRARAKEDDLIVVYIASHGSPREEDPNGVSYILMHDTKFNDAANLYATSLQMIYLVDILRRDVRAKRVALILDTCFSGDATSSRGVVVHTPNKAVGPASDFSVAADRIEDKAPDGAARVVISASRANEQSLEDNGHGYFTRFLLEALRQNGGANSMRDVFQVVHDRTVDAVRERFGARGMTQTPTLRSTPAGLDIVLGAKASVQ
jgi:hypothetical protein